MKMTRTTFSQSAAHLGVMQQPRRNVALEAFYDANPAIPCGIPGRGAGWPQVHMQHGMDLEGHRPRCPRE
jgi:hypothetical protein